MGGGGVSGAGPAFPARPSSTPPPARSACRSNPPKRRSCWSAMAAQPHGAQMLLLHSRAACAGNLGTKFSCSCSSKAGRCKSQFAEVAELSIADDRAAIDRALDHTRARHPRRHRTPPPRPALSPPPRRAASPRPCWCMKCRNCCRSTASKCKRGLARPARKILCLPASMARRRFSARSISTVWRITSCRKACISLSPSMPMHAALCARRFGWGTKNVSCSAPAMPICARDSICSCNWHAMPLRGGPTCISAGSAISILYCTPISRRKWRAPPPPVVFTMCPSRSGSRTILPPPMFLRSRRGKTSTSAWCWKRSPAACPASLSRAVAAFPFCCARRTPALWRGPPTSTISWRSCLSSSTQAPSPHHAPAPWRWPKHSISPPTRKNFSASANHPYAALAYACSTIITPLICPRGSTRFLPRPIRSGNFWSSTMPRPMLPWRWLQKRRTRRSAM